MENSMFKTNTNRKRHSMFVCVCVYNTVKLERIHNVPGNQSRIIIIITEQIAE